MANLRPFPLMVVIVTLTDTPSYQNVLSNIHLVCVYNIKRLTARIVGLAPKWVRLDPKLDKSGTFSDQISVHFAHRAKCTEI